LSAKQQHETTTTPRAADVYEFAVHLFGVNSSTDYIPINSTTYSMKQQQ
jgi:hypothetical protein